MDRSEATKYVFNRIQKLEPENVSKIIGYLLLQDNGDQEMIRLAHGPDNVIFSFINKAKMELLKSAKIPVSAPISPSMSSEHISNLALEFLPFSPASSHPLSSSSTYRASNSYWEHQVSPVDQQLIRNMNFVPQGYSDSISDDYHISGLDDQLDPINTMGHELSSNYYYPEPTLGSLSGRTSRRSPSLPELKSCHYFNKGYCKHGNNCRYFHGSLSDSFSQMFSQLGSELAREEHIFSPGSLEKLELELTELLRSRRGVPVSIASLPMMYYEKYGRTLQAEGYLTESQRHGKAGYSLTKLLARLKNSIRLIDRPHGQHSVVLAEDAPNYMDYRSEKSDPGGIVAGSRQIYLTFPAESTFSEDDVSNYFENFGAVQDVRIPCQQKRMFGFVTFVHPETVKIILTKGNPHFVCGARVLVKPYREKSRVVVDRKYSEKIDTPMYYPSHVIEMDHELHSMPRVCESSRLLRKQFMEEQHALELERRRLSELHLATKPLTHQPPYYFMDDLKLSEDHNQYSYTDDFRYLFEVFNNGSTSDDKTRNSSSNDSDPETSQGINLPESPFASSMGTGISTSIDRDESTSSRVSYLMKNQSSEEESFSPCWGEESLQRRMTEKRQSTKKATNM